MRRYYLLRPSRLLTLLLILLGMAAVTSVFLVPLSFVIRFGLALTIACWTVYQILFAALLRQRHSCAAWQLDAAGRITLVLRNGEQSSGQLLPESLITPWLIVLHIVLDGGRKRRSLLILSDAMDAASYRRLRVELRWHDATGQRAA